MKKKLRLKTFRKNIIQLVIFLGIGEYPKVCVNLQTDVR